MTRNKRNNHVEEAIQAAMHPNAPRAVASHFAQMVGAVQCRTDSSAWGLDEAQAFAADASGRSRATHAQLAIQAAMGGRSMQRTSAPQHGSLPSRYLTRPVAARSAAMAPAPTVGRIAIQRMEADPDSEAELSTAQKIWNSKGSAKRHPGSKKVFYAPPGASTGLMVPKTRGHEQTLQRDWQTLRLLSGHGLRVVAVGELEQLDIGGGKKLTAFTSPVLSGFQWKPSNSKTMTLDHNRLSVEALEKLATDLEKVLSVSESYPSLLMDLQGIVDESGHFTIFDPPDKVSSGEGPGTRTRLATLKASILNVRALIAKKQSR